MMEPPTLRSITSPSSRRSYSCYNCNHAFHITPIPTTSAAAAASPSSFRCPRCLHRHLIPHHTVSPPPPPPPPPPQISNPSPAAFTYYTSDDSDYEDDDDGDGESDSSVLSFTIPNYRPSLPALKSFIDSLPIKTFPPNSTPPLVPLSCSICMEDFGIKSETVNELPCQHCFHKDCIAEWLNRSNTCPLCRYKLPVDPGPENLADSGEYDDRVFVVDEAPVMRRSNAEVSLTSLAAAAEASIGTNRGGISGWGFEVTMRSNAGGSLISVAAVAAGEASGSDRRVVGTNSGGTSEWGFEVMIRSNAGVSLTSVAAGSDRRLMSTNSGEISEWGLDAMRDEDGDTLMLDA